MFDFGLFLLKAFSFLFAGLLAYFFVIVLGASLMKAIHGARVSGRIKARIKAAKMEAALRNSRRNIAANEREAAKSNAELLELIRTGTDAQVKSAERSLLLRARASFKANKATKRFGMDLTNSKQPELAPMSLPLATPVDASVAAKEAVPQACVSTNVSPQRPEATSAVAGLGDVDWFKA